MILYLNIKVNKKFIFYSCLFLVIYYSAYNVIFIKWYKAKLLIEAAMRNSCIIMTNYIIMIYACTPYKGS